MTTLLLKLVVNLKVGVETLNGAKAPYRLTPPMLNPRFAPTNQDMVTCIKMSGGDDEVVLGCMWVDAERREHNAGR